MNIHKNEVERCIRNNGDKLVTSRKIYLSYPTAVFVDEPDLEFEIKNQIADFFNVGIHCVQFTGSAKTGWSFHSEKEFEKGESDLDAAIISSENFIKYISIISSETNKYTNLSGFRRNLQGVSHADLLRDGIARHSLINLKYLPNGETRQRISKFFNRMTREYNELFREISVVIYATASCFENKQRFGFPEKK
jgi:hypothetical protein